jgi:gamma-glutamyltranspeptidase/glutathione hydrolase
MVTLIQSNYEGFGSAVVVPGTGIHLQNRGACFVLAKGHPNEVGGGKRPYHTIIPAMVTRPNEFAIAGDIGPAVAGGGNPGEQPLMAFGVMGGFMQPQGHVQVLTRLADFGQNPQAALDAPRWQVKEGLKVIAEPGHPEATYDELRRRGHDLEVKKEKLPEFGYGQAILKLEAGYAGASDGRGDGQAVGY